MVVQCAACKKELDPGKKYPEVRSVILNLRDEVFASKERNLYCSDTCLADNHRTGEPVYQKPTRRP